NSGTSTLTADRMHLWARDESEIDATVGAVSIGFSYAPGFAGALTIDVAVANNEISSNVEASAESSTITLNEAGESTIVAEQNANIDALSIAVALGAGISTGGLALAVTGAGANSLNSITGDTKAFLSTSTLTSSSGPPAINDVDLTLNATNAADIDATIVAVALAVAGSLGSMGAAASVPIGAAVTENNIGSASDRNEVKAFITDSTVAISGDLEVHANFLARINAGVGAGAMGVALAGGAISGGGLAASGSGVSATNDVFADVKANLAGGSGKKITAQDIDLKATDLTDIDADAGAAALSVVFGGAGAVSGGVTLAIAASIAKNEINNQVHSYIQDYAASDGIVATGDLTIATINKAEIDVHSHAASLTVGVQASFAALDISLSGAGASSENIISNDVRSYINNSKVTTNSDYEYQSDHVFANTETLATNSKVLVVRGNSTGALTRTGQIYQYTGPNLTQGQSVAGVPTAIQLSTYDYHTNPNWTLIKDTGTILSASGTNAATVLSSDDSDQLIYFSEDVGTIAKQGDFYRYIGAAKYATNVIPQNPLRVPTGIDPASRVISYRTPDDTNVANIDLGTADLSDRTEWVYEGRGIIAQSQSFTVAPKAEVAFNNSQITNGAIAVSGHGLQDDDIVRYERQGSDGLDLGGLISGNEYKVQVDQSNPQSFRLYDISGQQVSIQPGNSPVTLVNVSRDPPAAFTDYHRQKLTFGTTGSGTFTLRLGNSTTAPIIFSSDMSAGIQAAINEFEEFSDVQVAKVNSGSIDQEYFVNRVPNDVSDIEFDEAIPGPQAASNHKLVPVAENPVVFLSNDIQGGSRGDLYRYRSGSSTNSFTDRETWEFLGNNLQWNSRVHIDAFATNRITAMTGATAGSVSVAASPFGAAVGGAIGASVVNNLVGIDSDKGNPLSAKVHSYIEASTIDAAGRVDVLATQVDQVDSVSYAGAVAVAVGAVGGTGAGAGASTKTYMSTEVLAYIKNSDVISNHGDIEIKSTSASTVERSQAVGVAIAAAIAPVGAAISVGASLSETLTQNTVNAYVLDDSTGSTRYKLDAANDVAITSSAITLVDDVKAVTASVAAGIAAVSGGGVSIINDVNNSLQAYVKSKPRAGDNNNPTSYHIETGENFNLAALEFVYLIADAGVGAAAVGLGGALGVALAENKSRSTIKAIVESTKVTTKEDFVVSSRAVNHLPDTFSIAISAGLVAGAGNSAKSIVQTTVESKVWSGSIIDADSDILISSDAYTRARANGAGGVLGGVAVGAMTADIELGNRATGNADVLTVIGNPSVTDRTSLTALGNIDVQTSGHDDLYAETTAAGGGVVAALGASTHVWSDYNSEVSIGQRSEITGSTVTISANHFRDIDAEADSYTFALLAGSGAGQTNETFGDSRVTIKDHAVIKAENLFIDAINSYEKNHVSEKEGVNLRTAGASLAGISALSSTTRIGTSGNPLLADINIANGVELTAEAPPDSDKPSVLSIQAFAETKAYDQISINSVAGMSINVAVADLDSDTDALVTIGNGVITNNSGDVHINTRSRSSLNGSATSIIASYLSTLAVSDVRGDANVDNKVQLNGTRVTGNDIYIQAGRDRTGNVNLMDGYVQSQLTMFSTFPSIPVPIVETSINESNLVDITGNAEIRARGDVMLITDPSAAPDGVLIKEFAAMVLAVPPIPIPPQRNDGDFNQTATVTVSPQAIVEAGSASEANVAILPLPDDSDERASIVNGASLTAAERTAYSSTHSLSFSADVEYVYQHLSADQISVQVYGDTYIYTDVPTALPTGATPNTYYLLNSSHLSDIEADYASVVIANENFSDTSKWTAVCTGANCLTVSAPANSAFDVYKQSNVKGLKDKVNNKIYAIRPASVAPIQFQWVQLKNLLQAELDQIAEWMIEHIGDLKQIAIYEARREQILSEMKSLGFTQAGSEGNNQPDGIVPQKDLSTLLVELPPVTSSPGSIFVEQDNDTSPESAKWRASSGANISINNRTTFGLNVGDVRVLDKERVVITENDDGTKRYVSFAPGAIFVNQTGPQVHNRSASASVILRTSDRVLIDSNAGDSRVTVGQTYRYIGAASGISFTPNTEDYSQTSKWELLRTPYVEIRQEQDVLSGVNGDLRSQFPDTPPQNLYVVGEVLNENGNLLIRNKEGGISISGSTRSANTVIESAGNFTLNADAWFHSNADPRQYVNLTDWRSEAVANQYTNSGRRLAGDTEWTQEFLPNILRPVSSIRALGTIDITAQFINVNGLIQSGSPDLVLNITSDFNPTAFTFLANEDGTAVQGVNFGEVDQIPVDAFYNPATDKITVRKIKASGGEINLTGRILSTGNGELRVSDGQTSLTVNNQSNYDLNFESIDLSGASPGSIVITDLLKGSDTTIQRTTYAGGVTSRGAASAATVEIGTLQCTLGGSVVDCAANINNQNVVQKIVWADSTTHTPSTGQYTPVPGIYYAWTEGQSKTETTVTKYEQKSFNLFGGGTSFEDFISNDSGYTSRDTVYTDAQPLLESETLLNPANTEGRDSMVTLFGTTNANPIPTANYGVRYHNANMGSPVTEIEEWETGGGWMQDKVAHTKITQVQGVKDFYNHAIKAEQPINIVFDPGSATHDTDIQITTNGTNVHFGGMVKTGDAQIGLTNTGTSGSISCSENVYIQGSQNAGGFVGNSCNYSGTNATTQIVNGAEGEYADMTVVTYDPATNSYSFSDTSHLLNFGSEDGVYVSTSGPITLNIVSSTNRDNRILVDRIESTGGDVFINAPHGIYAADANSLIRGKEITLLANEGPIGGSHAINLDSDGVVEVSAESHIWLRETSGNLEIVEVSSAQGEIVLETVDGAIVNRNINKVFLSEEEIDQADRQQVLTGERAANVARQEMQLEETSKTRAYHEYWQTYRTFSAAVSEAGSFDTIGNARAIAIAGMTAYVADGAGGLRVLDVTDPSSITELGAYDAAANAKSVAIQGTVAYVANGAEGLLVLDITDPAAITKLGSFDTAGDAKSVAIQGMTAYVADGSNGLLVLDVTDPAAITQYSRFVAAPAGDAQFIEINDNTAYLADGTEGLRVLDITDPAAITEDGFFDTNGNANSVAIRGTTAYVTDEVAGLRVLDITDPAAITEQGFFDTTGNAKSVAIQGSTAYVADDTAGLRALDVSDPQAITELDFFSTSDKANFVLVYGDHAYVADGTAGIRVLDNGRRESAPIAFNIDATTESTDTITFASPHGLRSGEPIRLSINQTNNLQTNLVSDTTYFAHVVSTNEIKLSASRLDAIDRAALNAPAVTIDIELISLNPGSGITSISAALSAETLRTTAHDPTFIAFVDGTKTSAVSLVTGSNDEIQRADSIAWHEKGFIPGKTVHLRHIRDETYEIVKKRHIVEEAGSGEFYEFIANVTSANIIWDNEDPTDINRWRNLGQLETPQVSDLTAAGATIYLSDSANFTIDASVLMLKDADLSSVDFATLEVQLLDAEAQEVHDTYGSNSYDSAFVDTISDGEINRRIENRQVPIEKLGRLLSSGLVTRIYPEVAFQSFGTATPASAPVIIGRGIHLKTAGSNGNIGEVEAIVALDLSNGLEALTDQQYQQLSRATADDVIGVQHRFFQFNGAVDTAVGVEIREENFEAPRWTEITIAERTGAKKELAPTVSLTSSDIVLKEFFSDENDAAYGLYRYVGSSGNITLSTTDFLDSAIWTSVRPDFRTSVDD
ncbi:MAG TPA: hypothetical protein DEF45_07395, partial [Rhodopirellula sp.]|nr:hypothetical protein [Rhodopirellula sp.]